MVRDAAESHDTALTAQADRIARLDGAPRLPRARAEAPPVEGELLSVDGAHAVLRVVEWPEEASERGILGDRTGFLELSALPDPAEPHAGRAIAALIGSAAAAIGSEPGRRTQLLLTRPVADTASVPLLTAAGLTVDALWCSRPAGALPAPVDVEVRPATAADAEQVAELVIEEMRYHLPLTPFTRGLPVMATWARAAAAGDDPDTATVVAVRDGAVVGYAAGGLVDSPDDGLVRRVPPGPSGHLRSVGVAARARGLGVGSAVSAALAARHLAAGATRLTVAYLPNNPTAAPFWSGRGFVPLWTYWAMIVGTDAGHDHAPGAR